MKRSVLTTVAGAAALTLGLGLLGTAVPATAAPATAATPAATASAAPSAEAPTGPPTTAAPGTIAAKPAKASTSITITSPEDGAEIHGPRSFTVTGLAPAGATLEVWFNGDWRARGVADKTGHFAIPVVIGDDVPYEGYLGVYGFGAWEDLDWDNHEVTFDAPQSAPPTITAPVAGTAVVQPQPLGGTVHSVEFTGTGTPGDYVSLRAESAATPIGYFYPDYRDVVVSTAGLWKTTAIVSFGEWTFTATEVTNVEEQFAVTRESDPSPRIVVDYAKPAGYIEPPVITTPASPSSDDDDSSNEAQPPAGALDAERLQVVSQSAALRSVLPEAAGKAADRIAFGTATSSETATGTATADASPISSAAAARERFRSPRAEAAESTEAAGAAASTATTPATDDGDDPLFPQKDWLRFFDALVETFGVQLTGTADETDPGKLVTTIAGTGTPGTGIQVYAARASTTYRYLEGLYPAYFADDMIDMTGVEKTTVPAYDGRVTVGADGRWSTTVSLSKGPVWVTAFTVDKSDPQELRYSDAGSPAAINLLGTPAAPTAIDPAVATLAFTGSDSQSPAAAGVTLLLLGGALLLVGRRRRLRG